MTDAIKWEYVAVMAQKEAKMGWFRPMYSRMSEFIIIERRQGVWERYRHGNPANIWYNHSLVQFDCSIHVRSDFCKPQLA